MAKRWTDEELRFLRDNAGKMSPQALAETLSVRVDELEKKMEKLALAGNAETPSAKKAQTLKELSRHTENARKDFDRGVAALQKKKVDEAERHFLDLIQKYPDEKEWWTGRACIWPLASGATRPHPILTERKTATTPRSSKNRGNVAEAIEHLKHAARRMAAGGSSFFWLAARADRGPDSVGGSGAIKLMRHDRDFDPVRDTPAFQELMVS
jgi:hypothetical protein